MSLFATTVSRCDASVDREAGVWARMVVWTNIIHSGLNFRWTIQRMIYEAHPPGVSTEAVVGQFAPALSSGDGGVGLENASTNSAPGDEPDPFI